MRDELAHVPDRVLLEELTRRGVLLGNGYCYPAMASEQEVTDLIHTHGYEYGPWEFLELGHSLAEPPQWEMYAFVPEHFRRPVSFSSGNTTSDG